MKAKEYPYIFQNQAHGWTNYIYDTSFVKWSDMTSMKKRWLGGGFKERGFEMWIYKSKDEIPSFMINRCTEFRREF